jgi:hypothetical protein
MLSWQVSGSVGLAVFRRTCGKHIYQGCHSAAHVRHWCGSHKIPLLMFDFKNKIYYLLYVTQIGTLLSTLS